MFDKITIRARVSGEECVHLAQLHHLQVWTNADATKVEYKSSQASRFDGMEVKIQNSVFTLKCSLHKYYMLRTRNMLRNDTQFSISEARQAFEWLLFENGLIAKRVRIVYFEIGLNLYVNMDPIRYIEQVQSVVTSKTSKLWFMDANFKMNRQKTTEKYKQIRKYYKIYDKTHEMNDKLSLLMPTAEHILRIETVYKRHNERADTFMEADNLERLAKRFLVDWRGVVFFRDVRAQKGARKSELERARIIVNSSKEEYLEQVKEEHKQRKLTDKQYRTIREFIRDFDEWNGPFKTVISPEEKEYNLLIPKCFAECRK